MEGYRLPFSSTSWHNDSNGQRFLFFFLNLFLPCQPSSGITVIQVPSNQKKAHSQSEVLAAAIATQMDTSQLRVMRFVRLARALRSVRVIRLLRNLVGWIRSRLILATFNKPKACLDVLVILKSMFWEKIHHDISCFITLEQIGTDLRIYRSLEDHCVAWTRLVLVTKATATPFLFMVFFSRKS